MRRIVQGITGFGGRSIGGALLLVTQRASVGGGYIQNVHGGEENDREGYMETLAKEEKFIRKQLGFDLEFNLTSFDNDKISSFKRMLYKLVNRVQLKRQKYLLISSQGHGSELGWVFSRRVEGMPLSSVVLSPVGLLDYLSAIVPKEITFIILSHQCHGGLLVNTAEKLKNTVLRGRKFIIQTACSFGETTQRSTEDGVYFQSIYKAVHQCKRGDEDVSSNLRRIMLRKLARINNHNLVMCEKTGLRGDEMTEFLIQCMDRKRVNDIQKRIRGVTNTPQAMINGQRLPRNGNLVRAGPGMLFGSGTFGWALKIAHMPVSTCPAIVKFPLELSFPGISNDEFPYPAIFGNVNLFVRSYGCFLKAYALQIANTTTRNYAANLYVGVMRFEQKRYEEATTWLKRAEKYNTKSHNPLITKYLSVCWERVSSLKQREILMKDLQLRRRRGMVRKLGKNLARKCAENGELKAENQELKVEIRRKNDAIRFERMMEQNLLQRISKQGKEIRQLKSDVKIYRRDNGCLEEHYLNRIGEQKEEIEELQEDLKVYRRDGGLMERYYLGRITNQRIQIDAVREEKESEIEKLKEKKQKYKKMVEEKNKRFKKSERDKRKYRRENQNKDREIEELKRKLQLVQSQRNCNTTIRNEDETRRRGRKRKRYSLQELENGGTAAYDIEDNEGCSRIKKKRKLD